MLSNREVIKQSLALHLFFARIMKEHAFFLEIGFTQKDQNLIQQANGFQIKFEKILIEVILLSSGVISPKVLDSGEIITPFTLKAEMSSSHFTGVNINTNITQAEIGLKGSCSQICNPSIQDKVETLNNDVINLLMNFINFKDKVLSDVLSCDIFTRNYPGLITHMIKEARLYLNMIQKVKVFEEIISHQKIYAIQAFWDQIMEDHMEIMSILLDPSEKQLIKGAKSFEEEFKMLATEAIEKEKLEASLIKTTCKTIIVTKEIRDFKIQTTQGVLECEIRSVIIPLLADHVLREANHYLRILREI